MSFVEPQSSYRAHAERAWQYGGNSVAMHLAHLRHDGLAVAQPLGTPVFTVAQEPEGAAVVTKPFLLLPEEAAHILLDALIGHFGGHSDNRRLYTDYMAERKRVDQLTERLGRIAEKVAT